MHINEFNDSFGEFYMFWDAVMGKSYILKVLTSLEYNSVG